MLSLHMKVGCEDHRRRDPDSLQRTRRPAGLCRARDRLRTRSRRLGGGVSRALEVQGSEFRYNPDWRSCRTGAGRQFRRQPVFRLHRLWRHHQHRGAAGGRQQVSRHPHLRQCPGRRRHKVSGATGRRSDAARPQRTAAGIRAAVGRRYSKDPRRRNTPRPSPSSKPETAAAMPAFAALVGLHADDALAGFHLRRLLNGSKGVRMQLE